jgi:hypothetical protein
VPTDVISAASFTCASRFVPLKLAYWIARASGGVAPGVEFEFKGAFAALADMALHWLLSLLRSAEMRKWWTLSAKIFLLSGVAAHSGLLPKPKIISRSN